ncbi:hypothetical protein M728_005302 (plasmid) [Ensifer sp. WSM1721]
MAQSCGRRPPVGEFFARLIDAEIGDIARFRTSKKLAAYAGLVPSTYSSGGKTFHGKIIKQGNKWLRWAFVKAVAPAIASDAQLRAQYEHLKIRGTNKARVAIARDAKPDGVLVVVDPDLRNPLDKSAGRSLVPKTLPASPPIMRLAGFDGAQQRACACHACL